MCVWVLGEYTVCCLLTAAKKCVLTAPFSPAYTSSYRRRKSQRGRRRACVSVGGWDSVWCYLSGSCGLKEHFLNAYLEWCSEAEEPHGPLRVFREKGEITETENTQQWGRPESSRSPYNFPLFDCRSAVMGEIPNYSFSHFQEMKSVIMNVCIRDRFRVTFVVLELLCSSGSETSWWFKPQLLRLLCFLRLLILCSISSAWNRKLRLLQRIWNSKQLLWKFGL